MVLPPPVASGLERQTGRTQSVESCPDVTPSRTSPAVPEILLGNAQHLFGAESPPQDRQHSGRLLRHPLPPSCPRPQPRDRRGNAATRCRSTVMPLPLPRYPASALPTARLTV